MKTLFKNAEIITMDEETGDIKDGHVLVEDDRILYVGAFPPYCPDCGRTVECRGKVLMPGLVNAHCHLPMTLLRGYAEELPLDKWLYGRIFPAETRMTAERAYWGALLGMAEMISTGTVAVTDMYFMGESVARAAGEAGIRANITHTLTCPDEDFDFSKHEGVRRADALFESCNGLFDGRVTVEYEIHALYTANERFVRMLAEKIAPLNTGLNFHLSETRREVELSLEKYGRTPVRVFHDAGAFRNRCVAAHCVWLTEEDVKLLAEGGVNAVHNPSSNLKLGSGIADVRKLLLAGAGVALGTDGCASNNNLNMFEEMHLAAMVPKGANCDPLRMPAAAVLKTATLGGARAQGRAGLCGAVAEGYKADLVLVDFDRPHLTPNFDTVSALVYSAQGSDVCLTMADGKILYENGEFKTIDIEKVKSGALRAAREMTDGL